MPTPPADPIELLLAACLDRAEGEWEAAVAAACAQHPPLAGRLRARFDSLRGLGMAAPTAAADRVAGQRLGGYQLLEVLGAGASATVYRARDAATGAIVALKVLRGDLAASGRWRERFDREVRLAGRLDHPGLCRVLAWAHLGEQPFLAMSLVEGCTLAAEIATLPPSPSALARRLRVLVQVARALGCAHRGGLVHRDIKPGNVLVRPDGSAVLTDLGLAFAQEEGHDLTASDTLVGSPAYFAPELIHGSSRGSVASDIYALGVMLHECATGSLPFRGPSRAALFRQILAGERLPMGGDVALQRVAGTAMARQPRDRYGSAEDFAADVERCLAGARPLAQGPGPWRKVTDWVARNQIAAAVMLALGIGGAMAAIAFDRADAAFTRMRGFAITAAAGEAMHDDVDVALRLAEAAHRREPSVESRSLLYEALGRCHSSHQIPSAGFPAAAILAAGATSIEATAPGGLRVAATLGDSVVRVFGADGGLLATVPHPCAVLAVALAPGGQFFATGGGDGVARLHGISGPVCRLLDELRGHRGRVHAVAFTPSGDELLTLSDDGTARAWQCRARLGAVFSPSGGALRAVAPIEGGLLLLDHARIAVALDPAGKPLPVGWLRPSRGVLDASHRLLLQHGEDEAAIVDLAHGTRWPWRGAHAVELAAAPADSESVVTVDGDRVERWRRRDGVFAFDVGLATVAGGIAALAVAADAERFACGMADGRVLVFARDGQLLVERALHQEQVWWLTFRDDGRRLLTASRDETAWLGEPDLSRGLVLAHGGTVLCAAFSPGRGDLVATGCVDGTARLWRDDGTLLAVLRGHRGQVEHVTFAAAGHSLLTASADHSVRTWPIGDEALLQLAAAASVGQVAIPERYRDLLSPRQAGR